MVVKTVLRIVASLSLLCWTPLLAAQETTWAEKLFNETRHDFGVVARGADARCRITITNIYAQAVHIAEVRTTCGCTAAKPDRDTILSRETAHIDVAMNTLKFTQQKDSSVIVVIDAPLRAEVRIPIRAYIRPDVVLTPGAASFGALQTGGSPEVRHIQVAYAGRNDWAIRDVIVHNPNLTVKISETGRGGGRVNYDLTIALAPDVPVGDLREQLSLVTNDANSFPIPLLVEARVEPEFTVTPEIVSFGALAPGQKKTMNVVVRGRKPFAILKVQGERPDGPVEVAIPGTLKSIHVLSLTLTAPADPSSIDETYTVTINGSASAVPFRVYAKVVAAPSQSSPTGRAVTAR